MVDYEDTIYLAGIYWDKEDLIKALTPRVKQYPEEDVENIPETP